MMDEERFPSTEKIPHLTSVPPSGFPHRLTNKSLSANIAHLRDYVISYVIHNNNEKLKESYLRVRQYFTSGTSSHAKESKECGEMHKLSE